MNITQNLERNYKVFIDRERPFYFFKGLAEYLDYVFSVPNLKEVFEKESLEHLKNTNPKRGQAYKLCSDFEKLYYFRVAYDAVSKDINFWSIYIQNKKRYKNLTANGVRNICEMIDDLELLKSEQQDDQNRYARIPHDKISRLHIKSFRVISQTIHNYFIDTVEKNNESRQDKNSLSSLHLVTDSLEPQNTIFLVLDENYHVPIRCSVKNKNGKPAYIKKLYDIAYPHNVQNKKVEYTRGLADSINNGLFRKRQIAKYMRTNKFSKPTLVQKSEDNTLVLKNEILVKTNIIKNIPLQHQSLYIDKTK